MDERTQNLEETMCFLSLGGSHTLVSRPLLDQLQGKLVKVRWASPHKRGLPCSLWLRWQERPPGSRVRGEQESEEELGVTRQTTWLCTL